ncbi:50S ribosomal protein L24 [Aeromicrobium fastidiosum]|uniref:Large ribosomal subunit protein uL24 n=1 Tax=Aeromicrobium fastidiosum TaxID=52699 RepID=A0A641AIN0_9ACTN|nr:50S ribosomal protein L24 [Aeromicrobium fastidiosum]KAA1374727.1 50S ribosomal protein L24 [Aeromicrobium fastidiosum]MBP2390724.1 large subunit ribosomal protein L24 [Aeromicrobium fastidiosum]
MARKGTVSIRKGDQVKVIAGKDKGVTGSVIEVLAEHDRVIVEGVNRVKRHTKPSQAGGVGSGGIITSEAPIHISNVMLLADKEPTRVGYRRDDVTKTRPDGSTYAAQRSVRIAKKTGKEI